MKEQAYGGIGSPSVDVPCKVQGLAVKALPSVQALISRSASRLMPRAPQDRRFRSIRWQMILIGSELVAALQNVEALFERVELGPLTAFRATPMPAPALVLPRLLAITTHPQHRRELANTALIGFDHIREVDIRHACDLQNSKGRYRHVSWSPSVQTTASLCPSHCLAQVCRGAILGRSGDNARHC